MKTGFATKLISLSLVLAFTASSASCSSRKRSYRTIKDSDAWYECSSFDVSELYASEEYEYCYFETVGATEDTVYIKAEAVKHFDGDYREMSDEDYIKLYEQSILELSYEGELLGKTVFDPVVDDGVYKALQKAWLFDGKLNILEQVFDSKLSINAYYLNGKHSRFLMFGITMTTRFLSKISILRMTIHFISYMLIHGTRLLLS